MADFSGGMFRLNDNKAGLSQMDGLSKDDISRILTEASKGSLFHENKKVKHKLIEERIASKKDVLAKASAEDFAEAERKAKRLIEELEDERDLSRTIVHVDMDMFFAAVEMRDNPQLKTKPVAVGCSSMLSTSNYVARRYGVRAAQPGFLAKKLCPDLIIIPPNFVKYQDVGRIVRQLFAEYDPNFVSASLDEAYLDITDHLHRRSQFSEAQRTVWQCDCLYLTEKKASIDPIHPDSGAEIESCCPRCGRPAEKIVAGVDADGAVHELRIRIFQKTSLTCSAGISCNTMLAKICTDKNKPNGQYQLPSVRDVILEFIRDLPVRKVPGIGAATEEILTALGVTTCGDLNTKGDILALVFSDLSLEHFLRVSLGIGSTVLDNDDERKSISTERTFRELWKPEDLFKKLEELTEDLGESMEEKNICGRCVTIKLKLITFETYTRANSVPRLIGHADEIYPIAKKLLETEIRNANGKLRLRLMGVRVSQLQDVAAADDKFKQKSISQFLVPAKQIDESSPVHDTDGAHTEIESPIMQLDEEVNECSVISPGVDQNTLAPAISIECPNCAQTVQTDPDFVQLNQHIDLCLNSEQLSDVSSKGTKRLKLEDPVIAVRTKTPPSKPKTKRITDYFAPSTSKVTEF
ncbi:DNA polymerase kappa-like [Paramacrobiotus metropolitanus]|uniref:DNA polymerase kappa-like n=1 Tax=Paramacrobiotus metropolitanus TaxID=2943436 RepID=UPI00244608FF|nr:DNA polymerase kappa-like [Paramacrobiotus metropolitanus]